MNAGRRGPHDPAGLKVSGLVYVHDTAVKEHLNGGKTKVWQIRQRPSVLHSFPSSGVASNIPSWLCSDASPPPPSCFHSLR